MGLRFHDWIDYNGVAFSKEFNNNNNNNANIYTG